MTTGFRCCADSDVQQGKVAASALKADSGEMVGKPVPAFEAKDSEGKQINTANWKGKVTLINFFASWCGPCKLLEPMLDKQADEFTGKIKFVKINVDEAAELAKRYGIQAIPTLLFFNQGKMVDSVVGLPSEDALKGRLESLAAASEAK